MSLCLAAVVSLGSPAPILAAEAGQPCEVVPMPCTFEGVPFKFQVVDAETRQPLANVHALAEWQTEGVGGRAGGPLMVKDTLSDSDGQISFDAWGPIQGPWTGLVIGSDPVVTLFKAGYMALRLDNGYLPPGQERERVRKFVRKDTAHALESFRGTPEQWLQQLRGALGLRGSDEQILRFRGAYLNRLRLISAERPKLPREYQRVGKFFWHVDRELKFLEEGHR
jgi:hypothetical protein